MYRDHIAINWSADARVVELPGAWQGEKQLLDTPDGSWVGRKGGGGVCRLNPTMRATREW